jgi:hypothetical protein
MSKKFAFPLLAVVLVSFPAVLSAQSTILFDMADQSIYGASAGQSVNRVFVGMADSSRAVICLEVWGVEYWHQVGLPGQCLNESIQIRGTSVRDQVIVVSEAPGTIATGGPVRGSGNPCDPDTAPAAWGFTWEWRPVSSCSNELVSVDGRAGEDWISAGFPDGAVRGGPGNDTILARSNNAVCEGGPGDDSIIAWDTGVNESLLGGDGVDLLNDANMSFRQIDGGPDFDETNVPAPTPPNVIAVEQCSGAPC